jgi:hypothetical protein
MVNKYPSDVPYTLSKDDLEGRLIQVGGKHEPILARIIEVKQDGDRLGNRTVLIKHILENNTELVLAKHLRSVSHKQEFNTVIRQFETRSGWKTNEEISDEDKKYSNTGKALDRFIERTAVVSSATEHKTSTTVFNR